MKKYFIEIVAIFIALILMSTVTAVPQTYSKPAMDLINNIEDKIDVIEFENFKHILDNVRSGGIIDLLIQLVILIIQFIMELVGFVSNVIGLVTLIQNLIDAATTLFQLIQDLIEIITNIFNPGQLIIN
jgi:hypothetical protein